MSEQRLGNWMAALSFFLWGILPLYYQFLPNAAMDELLPVRLLASIPCCLLICLAVTRKLPNIKQAWADKRSLKLTFIGTVVMSLSWTAFIWALTHNRVIDASLGFFITPLMMCALGVMVFGEVLSPGKKIALTLATIGLSYQIIQYGEMPFIALIMAIFFSLYGLCKKKIAYSWSTCLFMEALLLAPFAIGYLLFKELTVGSVIVQADLNTLLLYMGAAPATLIPLVFYSIAIRLTSMSTVGLMQYIEPSIQFLLAIFLFNEMFDEVKAISFGLIWIGLLLTILETSRNRYALKRL